MTDQELSEPTRIEPADPVFILGLGAIFLVGLTWAILTVMGAGRSKQVGVYNDQIRDLDAKLATLNDTQQTYTALTSVASHAKTLRDNRTLFGPTWTMLRDRVPQDVQFLSLNLGNNSTIRLIVTIISIISVDSFTRELEEQKDVSMVVPLSIEKSSTTDSLGFTLSFKVTPKAGTP